MGLHAKTFSAVKVKLSTWRVRTGSVALGAALACTWLRLSLSKRLDMQQDTCGHAGCRTLASFARRRRADTLPTRHPQVLVLPGDWAQAEEFLGLLRKEMREYVREPPYYPGIRQR